MQSPKWFIAGILCLPAVLAAPGARAALTVPSGYYSNLYAQGYTELTSVAFGPGGWLYTTQIDGHVRAFKDLDGNGAADTMVVFATGFQWPLCVTPWNSDIYVSSYQTVTKLTDTNGDHVADVTTPIVSNLPAGRHWTTAIAFGPDGNMYVGLGSNANLEVGDPWQAAILRFTPAGQFLDVFATGLRNPYDMGFNRDGQLFATDNGAGPDTAVWNCWEAPDELNWIRQNRNYGFPECFGIGDCAPQPQCNPQPCAYGDCQTGTGCTAGMTAPLQVFDPHSSSDGMVFGDAFKGYGRFDLFVAQFGQTEFIPGCETSHGHKVVHVRTRKQGSTWKADAPEEFATGFELPLDVTVGPDSALYVADYVGKIYRIFRTSPVTSVDEDVPETGAESPVPPFRMSPNPASVSARLLWSSPPPAGLQLEVFDVSGRLVSRLEPATDSGSAEWDLRDLRGRPVAPGLYLVRVSGGATTATARLLVVN